MHVTLEGKKTAHKFGRGLMRSAARLTYEQVQEAADGTNANPLPGTLLTDLYGAFRALLGARQARGTLDLDLPERRVVLDENGHVVSVAPRARLDSHRLIEEFMVLANVCAAEELERIHRPCMYRVHAPPSDEKLVNLRGFLNGIGISLPPGNQIHPRDLDRVLVQVKDTEQSQLVNEVILRSQSQAAYSPDNIGHFGLALSRYAPFYQPDPPLFRPAGPSCPDHRATPRHWRPQSRRDRTFRRYRRTYQRDRTPCRARRTRRH